MAQSEVADLLKHPDPRERALALKLDGVTSGDLCVAILDPHPLVWKRAMGHPDSSLALDNLASSTRDAAGNVIFDRHDALMADPRFTSRHLSSMFVAVKSDSYLPLQQQFEQLGKLRAHKLSSSYMLTKREENEAHSIISNASLHKDDIPIKFESEGKPHPELLNHYENHVNSSIPLKPDNSNLYSEGASSKLVYKTPDHRFIVKPYSETENPISGWSEGTSQELYGAAGIGHLHQKSFVATHGSGTHHTPVTVIKAEDGSIPAHKAPLGEVRQKNLNVVHDSNKIALMDFLTGNGDRTHNNLMVKPDGGLLAIDHANSFAYAFNGNPQDEELRDYSPSVRSESDYTRYTSGATSIFSPTAHSQEGLSGHFNTIKTWWPQVRADIRRSFDDRLFLIKNPSIKEHLSNGFKARYNYLESVADGHVGGFGQSLKKAVLDPQIENDTLPTHHEKIHSELKTAHPKSIQDDVDYFEKHVNSPNKIVEPKGSSWLDGVEPKAMVEHGGKKWILKQASQNRRPMSSWNELTSQHLYHAAGIGHLHQKVHVTDLNVLKGGKIEKQPALVIHMEPDSTTGLRVPPEEDIGNRENLRKCHLMDFLTDNTDRHTHNIVMKADGSPLMIDHSDAFVEDGKEKPSGEAGWWLHQINPLSQNNLKGNENTYNWWKQNSSNIVNAMYRHLEMVPDKLERARRKTEFDKRVNAINNKHSIVFGPAGLSKALQGADFLHNQHTVHPPELKANNAGVHQKLLNAHPKSIDAGVRHFEFTINKHDTPVKPVASQQLWNSPNAHKSPELKGIQPKSIYKSDDKHYMVKPEMENSSTLGAWNELTSQAMYHAGGIGHLHQKVHATVGNTGKQGNNPTNALAIHMEPDAVTWSDAIGEGDGNPYEHKDRVSKTLNSDEHKASLRQIGVMDFLTNNTDRHTGNIVVKPDGSPIAIDHGRAFFLDRKHTYGPEDHAEDSSVVADRLGGMIGDHKYQKNWWETYANLNAATKIGGAPDAETFNWWDKNKENILNKFKEHVSILPEANAQQRMTNSFMERYNHLNTLSAANKAGVHNLFQWTDPETGNIDSIPDEFATTKGSGTQGYK